VSQKSFRRDQSLSIMKTGTSKEHKITDPLSFTMSRAMVSLIVGGCNLRGTSRSQGLLWENTLEICARCEKLSERKFLFRRLRNRVLPDDFLSFYSRTISSKTQCHSTSRRLCHFECRKTISTYESTKEVYELLSVHENALFMTNGIVSRHT